MCARKHRCAAATRMLAGCAVVGQVVAQHKCPTVVASNPSSLTAPLAALLS